MVKVRFLIIILLAVFLVTTGFGCKQNIINKEKFQPITLQYWGVWDTPEQMQSIIKAYTATHPTIKVEYKNFRYDEYEQKLLEAAWEDRVPDVFMIPASKVSRSFAANAKKHADSNFGNAGHHQARGSYHLKDDQQLIFA